MINLVTFQVGKRIYGIDSNYILDMDFSLSISKSILLPKYVKGLDEIKGNVIALIDVNSLLFDDESQNDYKGKLTLKGFDEPVSKALLVSEVLNVIELSPDQIHYSKDHVYISAHVNVLNAEVMILNMENILLL